MIRIIDLGNENIMEEGQPWEKRYQGSGMEWNNQGANSQNSGRGELIPAKIREKGANP